jgi:hypothetical protein
MSLAAHLNARVFAFGSVYTLLRLVELDGKAFAVLTDDGVHEIYASASWVYPIA